MQGYASDYPDRYGAGFESTRGPRRGFRPPPRRGYDVPYAREFSYDEPQGRGGYRGGGSGYQPSGQRGWAPNGYGGDYAGAQRTRSSSRDPREYRFDADGGGAADSIRAAEIMTRNPEAVTPDTPLAEVARRMRDLDVGVMPVIADEESYHLEGIVTDRDIAIRAAAEGMDMKKTKVSTIMSPDPHTVGESDHVRDVFTVMKRARVRRVPVTGPDGRLLGIIAQADLAVTYAGLDLQRETEVEEVIERISEPARPRWGREEVPDSRSRLLGQFRQHIDIDIPDQIRSGWRTLRREAREFVGRGYDRGWR